MMDDFPGLLPRDFGLRPQSKPAPMSSGRSSRSAWDRDHAPKPPDAFDDVFGTLAEPPYNSVLDGFGTPPPAKSGPVYDRPVYDEDMFVGIPGLKPSSSQLDDVFASPYVPRDHEDDLLKALSGKGGDGSRNRSPPVERSQKGVGLDFDELIPGFGKSEPAPKREHQDSDHQHSIGTAKKSATTASNDPFADLGTIPIAAQSSPALSVDHLENVKFSSGETKSTISSGSFDDINVFSEFKKKSDSSVLSDRQTDGKNKNTAEGSNHVNLPVSDNTTEKFLGEKFNNALEKQEFKKVPQEHPFFDTPIEQPVPRPSSARQDTQTEGKDKWLDAHEEHHQEFDDIWLSVSEVPLFTQPTKAPPPSRPPPPLAIRHTSFASTEKVVSNYSNVKRNTGISSSPQQSENYMFSDHLNSVTRGFGVPSVDVLEEFAASRPQSSMDDHVGIFYSGEQPEANSAAATSAAAMKEAMDRAEAKFKHARELREREKEHRSFKNRDFGQQQQTNDVVLDQEGLEIKETRLNFDFEREQREKEVREAKRKLEREREKAAVEKAMKEAQERAAAEARQRAQRAAVEKANAEARERASRAAVLRAEAVARAAVEARERAMKEAKEKAAREARERESREREAREREVRDREFREKEAREREAREREAREKATRDRERAAVERAAEDARRRAARAAVEKANAEARERAAAAAAAAATAKEKPFKNDDDIDSFFGMGARANSQPKQRTTNTDPFNAQGGNQGGTNGARSSTGPSSNIRKASSATNILDDLSSVFGGAPSSGEFQEIEGETEERRKARFERHQRTLERAAKAVAEKNERDIQTQHEQAERHRIAETLDVEIRRWAAGKEGNLRALLSTLHYVLWPDCGWQPVSLTDLITAAAVKKVYRKATLCIHPDKVQQKGANLQQKYIAEKVFDLLKEAWNKLNSEELF